MATTRTFGAVVRGGPLVGSAPSAFVRVAALGCPPSISPTDAPVAMGVTLFIFVMVMATELLSAHLKARAEGESTTLRGAPSPTDAA